MGVQMIEIYNEQVRDLLSNDSSQKKYPFIHPSYLLVFITSMLSMHVHPFIT